MRLIAIFCVHVISSVNMGNIRSPRISLYFAHDVYLKTNNVSITLKEFGDGQNRLIPSKITSIQNK